MLEPTPTCVTGPVDARELLFSLMVISAPPSALPLVVVVLLTRFWRAAGRGRLPDCIPAPLLVIRSAVFTRRSLLVSYLAV